MPTTLFNPTNERFKAQYIGHEDYIFAPRGEEGDLQQVNDSAAKHILNILWPRGLTQLDFGDEGKVLEKKAADGVRRNRAFKEKCVIKFNRNNESRQARHMEYVEPTTKIREYAKELGVKLKMPYIVPEVNNNAEIVALKQELKEREAQFNTLQAQLNQVLSALNQEKAFLPPSQSPRVDVSNSEIGGTTAKKEEKAELVLKEYKSMSREHFKTWLLNRGVKQRYPFFPETIQDDIKVKWERFYTDEIFPY